MQGHKNTTRIQWSEKAAETNKGYVKYYVSNDVKSSLCRSQAEGYFMLTQTTKEICDKMLYSSLSDNLFRTCICWVIWITSDFENNVEWAMNAVFLTKKQKMQTY
jgi:phosphopantothenoylcysteine synthetase/decarboxylase